MKFRRILMLAIASVMVLAAVTVMTGCGTDDIDISGYAKEKIVLSGLGDRDRVVTVKELKAMDCKTVKTHSTSDKIGEIRATGPWLSTLLEEYGYEQTDFSKIVFYGKDRYDIKLNADYLKEHEIMLAFGIDGQPLDEESKPVRVIIEESDSAYWIRMVEKIEFIK